MKRKEIERGKGYCLDEVFAVVVVLIVGFLCNEVGMRKSRIYYS